MSTMTAAQSSTSSTSSAIVRAAIAHSWLFTLYVGVLVLVIILTWLVWRSGNKLQDAVRADADARIATAQADAENARARAAEANRVAAKAEENLASANERAALAEQHAAEANRLAESFRLDIAKANERAATANEVAEKEKLARLQLEARLAPRSLTESQQQSIATALKPIGAMAAQIFTYSDVTEVLRIGDNIAKVLALAGWTVGVAKASGGITVTGIVVAVGKDASRTVRNAAARLATELLRNGLSAEVSATPMEEIPAPGMTFGSTLPSPQIRILIGTK